MNERKKAALAGQLNTAGVPVDPETGRATRVNRGIDDLLVTRGGETRDTAMYGGIKAPLAVPGAQESEHLTMGFPDNSLRQRYAALNVTRNERTYNPESDPTGKLFLGDIARQFANGDVRSGDRLARHMHEESVERAHEPWAKRSSNGVGTGAFAGLTVPQYLVDMVAPAVAGLRPFADICNKHPLPAEGMSVNISRVTTPSSADLQADELDAVSMTDMDDTLLTVPVQTASGSQLISRQAIERGTGIEDTILQDLIARYNTTLDATLINQATTGLSAVAHDNDYTDSTPTASELYPLIVGAASQVATAVLGLGHPSHAVMHPRRWYWMQAAMVSTWPAFGQPGVDPRNVGANNNTPYNGGVAGRLPCGLDVIMDANVATTLGSGTNQDEVYVLPWREAHLWEDTGAPVFIRAEQPSAGKLGVLLVVYGYFAYSFQRYANAFQKLSDTGLVAPAGF